MNSNSARSPITTHVLDTARGCPAAGMGVTLEFQSPDGQWKILSQSKTNPDGRVAELIKKDAFQKGCYRLSFDTSTYQQDHKSIGFYPQVQITFLISKIDEHYHVPLLISPYGYSTYRGS